MGNGSDLNRRKFMEIGIYSISGTIAAVSGVALTRFSIGPSFKKKKSKWNLIKFLFRFELNDLSMQLRRVLF